MIAKKNVQQWSQGDIVESEREFTEDLDRNKHPSLKTVSRTCYRGSRTTKSDWYTVVVPPKSGHIPSGGKISIFMKLLS